jgi:hypothetical protein
MERVETMKNSGASFASTMSGSNLAGMTTSTNTATATATNTATATTVSSTTGSTTGTAKNNPLSSSSSQQQQKDDKEGLEEIVLTPAQAAAESSSKNPSYGYNLAKNNRKKVAIAYDVVDDHTQKSSSNKDEHEQSKNIFEICFDKCIDIIAYIIARILNHPDVRDAASTAILEGMIKLFYVDNLHDHVKNVDTMLAEHQVSDAAKKGKDTTKIVKAYLGGIFSGDEETKTNNSNNNISSSTHSYYDNKNK